ncbi:MAG: recombination-associated protein RdgC [Victivallales bacterium]
MPFEHGTFAVTMFSLPEDLPENYIELFNRYKAGPLDSIKDEALVGWVGGRHLLETEIDEGTAICGGMIYLNLRKAERKVPSSLLKAVCKREELAYQHEHQTSRIPSNVRKEIKEKAVETYLHQVPPSLTGIPMVIDPTSKMLYLGAVSTAQIDLFIEYFQKTTGIEPLPVNPEWYLAKDFQVTPDELPNVMFSEYNDGEVTTGRDFLTWLWYFSEQEGGGALEVKPYGEFAFYIQGPLTFAAAAETRGAVENTVKDGDPLRAAEAKTALTVGKKLKKAKFVLERGSDAWNGTIDADLFAFSGFSLPESEEMDADSIFAERITNLEIFRTVLAAYFKVFAETLMSDKWGKEENKIRRWVDERETR